MGQLNQNSDQIIDYSVTRVKESGGLESLHVEIQTNSNSVKYRITADDNHPDLNIIEQQFNSGLSQAKNSNEDLYLNDYEERMYLYVTFPVDNLQKYTAQKL